MLVWHSRSKPEWDRDAPNVKWAKLEVKTICALSDWSWAVERDLACAIELTLASVLNCCQTWAYTAASVAGRTAGLWRMARSNGATPL